VDAIGRAGRPRAVWRHLDARAAVVASRREWSYDRGETGRFMRCVERTSGPVSTPRSARVPTRNLMRAASPWRGGPYLPEALRRG
jgi:hypothetical protein